MKCNEVQQLLTSREVPKHAYSLHGENPNEAYCLSCEGDTWTVYYSERGLKTGLTSFCEEHKACEYFLLQLEKAGLLTL